MDTYYLALSTFINTLKCIMIERQRYWIPRANSTALMQHTSLQETTIPSTNHYIAGRNNLQEVALKFSRVDGENDEQQWSLRGEAKPCRSFRRHAFSDVREHEEEEWALAIATTLDVKGQKQYRRCNRGNVENKSGRPSEVPLGESSVELRVLSYASRVPSARKPSL
ncbi:hypothetical protein V1478_008816 [Vespula squamosa]|uniref:Uncharacterized protein n=1 Tax=Vespula squamosa TaxID=30214 RepID=A0ABD2AUM9_VESSQ